MHDQLKRIVADTLGLEAGEIPDDASMRSLDAWDSVAHLNIILSVEQELGLKFSPEEVLELTSLEALAQAAST